jgi:hypothetical protein
VFYQWQEATIPVELGEYAQTEEGWCGKINHCWSPEVWPKPDVVHHKKKKFFALKATYRKSYIFMIIFVFSTADK